MHNTTQSGLARPAVSTGQSEELTQTRAPQALTRRIGTPQRRHTTDHPASEYQRPQPRVERLWRSTTQHLHPQQHRQRHRVHGHNSRAKMSTRRTASAAATTSSTATCTTRKSTAPWPPPLRDANRGNHVRDAVGARPLRRRRPGRDAKDDPPRTSRAPVPPPPRCENQADHVRVGDSAGVVARCRVRYALNARLRHSPPEP